MDPEYEVLVFLYQKYSAIEAERKQKKEQQKMMEQIINEITSFTRKYIDSMRVEQFKAQYESLVGYYSDMKNSTGQDGVPNFQKGCRDVLEGTENFIIEKMATPLEDEIIKETYLLHAQIVCLMTASYIEINELYGYELESNILEIYEKNLKLTWDLESTIFNAWYQHLLTHNERFARVERWRSVYLSQVKRKLTVYRQYRDKLLNLIQIAQINNNPNFNSKTPDLLYGGFDFPRCSDYSIIEDLEDKTRKYLAINDRGMKDPNIAFASIVKDTPFNTVERDTEIDFDVVLKSLKPGRQVALVIYELRPSDRGAIENGEASTGILEIGDEWVHQTVKYRKQFDETSIRCEIYWYDRDPENLLIDKAYITLSPKLNPYLDSKEPTRDDTLHLLGWRAEEQRCRHLSLHTDFNKSYRTWQYIYAHNNGGNVGDPSIHQDSWVLRKDNEMENEFVFEAFVKNEEDITRKIQLTLWELGNTKLSPIDNHSETYEITAEWTRVQVRYKKKYPITFLRSEIYWFDQELAALLIDNARLFQTE
ncbi:hypothetical protein [Bacillus sp. Cr_A10]|uniref:hypothetical protein n=1 Tax=Bacillus sp. Cr_A10 TaxID=3033993 RepID=UPI0023DC2D92|nr:hypothetical protein [Bacillus sp. Cr_A10]MDF2066583.1 hypothetical protein [Bacillus sp. Cr_A10]